MQPPCYVPIGLTSHSWAGSILHGSTGSHPTPAVAIPHGREKRVEAPSWLSFAFAASLLVSQARKVRRRGPSRCVVACAASEQGISYLTDDMCLIPGDDPIVCVEEAPGNARRIYTGIDIRAKVDEVWQVMTDYEALEARVPNLVQNRIIQQYEDGGARLWQVGRASWRILGRSFFFQAGTTLDVHLHPDGCPEESLADADCPRKKMPLKAGVYPRPFSESVLGVSHCDITFENAPGTRGDFQHYRGMWRLQDLANCAPPGQPLMRLTFAVECEPHWFLPVAPVEGRIAKAMAQNMAAIRDHIESMNSFDETTAELAGYRALTKQARSSSRLAEIEWYSTLMLAALRPMYDVLDEEAPSTHLNDLVPHNQRIHVQTMGRVWRRALHLVADMMPTQALRIFLFRVVEAPNPFMFLAWQTKAGLSAFLLLMRQPKLFITFLTHCPKIIPHLPAIYTRLSVLEPHIPAIISILDPYLQIIRPQLDRIMERMDEIEPHLPYILLHLDVLAKHCGKLLDHFDRLLPFAYIDDDEEYQALASEHLKKRRVSVITTKSVEHGEVGKEVLEVGNGVVAAAEEVQIVSIRSIGERTEEDVELLQRRRSYLPLLLPYVDVLVPQLDDMADHLPYIRPHLPYILPYLDRVLPYVHRFKDFPVASKNADVLTAYLGWLFRLPWVARVLNIPLVPRVVAALSQVLPRWPVRRLLQRRWRRFHEENGCGWAATRRQLRLSAVPWRGP